MNTQAHSASFSSSAPSGAALAISSSRSVGALGNIVKSLDGKTLKASRKANRLASFASKRTAANLLRPHDEKLGSRVAACGYVAHGGDVDLHRQEHANGEVSSFFTGTVTCKSLWACPICSARISGTRRDELNTLLAWARAGGHSVVMLTLTARHSRKTDLVPFLSSLKDACTRLRQSRVWRGLGFVGSVTATEVTHGANGWHPHFHLVLILPASSGDALAAVETLRPEWLRCLGNEGLSGNQAAFQVQAADAVGDYISKFAAASEMTLGQSKSGRSGSRNPWQLLADARDGCPLSARLWVEFALAFKGRRQLVWSRGLRKLCEADIPPEPAEDEPEPVRLRRWGGSSDGWRLARRRLCSLLDAAEGGGDLDAAEFGPTDACRWRADLDASQVLDDGAAIAVLPSA